MPWLIDGSNVLGAMHVDRHGDVGKRSLARALAGFARAKQTRVTCIFDGPEPASFARHLGAVTIVFSFGREADDLIAEQAAQGRGWTVVTSDRGLASRVQRRQVEIVTAPAFLRQMETTAVETAIVEDWVAYFSDEKNRTKF
jgi:rRNA-processing protein FCF1